MDENLEKRLDAHERHSAERAYSLESELKRLEGIAMSHEGISDKVDVHNIFKGLGHDGGTGMLGGGLGAGLLGGVLGGLLFRRGGLGGGDGDGGAETRLNDSITSSTILNKLGNLEAAVPLAESQVQLAIAGQTSLLTQLGTTNATANALAVSGVKDAVQNAALLAQNNTTAILTAVNASTTAILSKIDGNTIAALQAELADVRTNARAAATEVNVTQNVNQNQQQAQAQVQLATLSNAVASLIAQNQTIHQGIVNLGTMTGQAGQQTAANTRVN